MSLFGSWAGLRSNITEAAAGRCVHPVLRRRGGAPKRCFPAILRPEREMAATDAEIDNLVYELYGITGEERKIIEGT